ncbi:MAG TPA: FAD-dependent oxidoreductase [Acidobacteriota bacterium]|nr:FAD-dependent oxidoreductase [Acidobacteriota bacterium]HNT17358.1 FAD-dependent oxidoreductase [Acidobacteriota bacterium]
MPRLVVIGGNAAGMSAASRAARTSSEWEVSVFDAGSDLSWGACGMPYVFSGEAAGFDSLFALSPEKISERGIETRIHSRALELSEGRKKVVFRDEKNGKTFEEAYDALLIATGSVPVIPDIRDISGDNFFVLHALSDGTGIDAYIKKERPRSVCIIGGGYIACEMAETLSRCGMMVTIATRSERFLGRLNKKFREKLALELEDNGVRMFRGAEITAVNRDRGRVISLETTRGKVPADFFLCATGVRAATDFLKGGPIPLGKKGGIETDGMCRTGVSSIWAAGDCCCVRNIVTGKHSYAPLGTTANKMGRVAGFNITGGREEFPGVLGTAITRVFGLEIALTGLGHREALEEGFDAEEASTLELTRPAYFRGAKETSVSIVCDRNGRIIGGQVIGGEGAKGRIDALAAVITGGLTVRDAMHLDLAYAPPFSPARDPLLTCLYALEKKLAR